MSEFWDKHARIIDPENFRADAQYLGCQREYPYEAMVAALGLPQWSAEDGAFGCTTHSVDGRMVSRDLLDSMAEIEFLRNVLTRVDSARVLDVGAGYGRFAHRFLDAYPTASVTCTDIYEPSIRICELYLAHRRSPARVVESDDLQGPFDLAVNIHCWPECTHEEIRWWLDKLAELRVPRLFVIPHDPEFTAGWGAGGKWTPSLPSFRPLIEDRYRLTDLWHGPACWPRTMTMWEAR